MNPTAEDRVRNLLIALSEEALELATSALMLAHPIDGPAFGLRFIPELSQAARRLEQLTVAALRQSGVSWDVLAERYGVSRQSMHRRLSEDVDRQLEQAQLFPDMNQEHAERLLETASALASFLQESLVDDWEAGPNAADARRRQPQSWWREREADG
ncbi:hypothetical protein [Wenjunlia tyrosinilytica]|uniref:Uncharacterized protein n=1 Tax=Wenjunlia tyrosinilytica TaxID=1544741 RepID=A0A917ZPD2_9ACTN|nr:hypothetical protein [Wenjunlia tyrosinilytica]GGO86480.1 hypothetical protein GCM10012280_22690 [Wenjunlia tyrosinilytica]